jgi:multiple sugar transport system permease protein
MSDRVHAVRSGALPSPRRRGWPGRLAQPKVRAAYLFIAPAMLGLVVFTFGPILAALYFSFTRYNVLAAPVWVGLDNYGALARDRIFVQSLWNTVYYTVGTIPFKIGVGLALALLLNQKLRGVGLFRGLYYLPQITSIVAVSIVWLYLYNPQVGLFNAALEAVGLPRQLWLLDPKLALPSVMVLGVWKSVGLGMVVYLAGLQGIPEQFYEAAKIDGAGRWASFWSVTLPLLGPTTFFLTVVNMIGTFQVFDQIYVMTNGGPAYATSTVVYQIYLQAFQQFHMGYASAIAVVLFLIIFALTWVNFRFRNPDVEY